jgi:hypothetical protein
MIQVDIVGLAGSVFGLVAFFIMVVAAMGRLLLSQFERRLDERFAVQETARHEGGVRWQHRFERHEDEQRELERDFLEFRADMPLNYVRREDQIRRDTVIDAKLDAINARLELVLDRRAAQEAMDGR